MGGTSGKLMRLVASVYGIQLAEMFEFVAERAMWWLHTCRRFWDILGHLFIEAHAIAIGLMPCHCHWALMYKQY